MNKTSYLSLKEKYTEMYYLIDELLFDKSRLSDCFWEEGTEQTMSFIFNKLDDEEWVNKNSSFVIDNFEELYNGYVGYINSKNRSKYPSPQKYDFNEIRSLFK